MICPLCGHEYDLKKAEADCEKGCRLWQKCESVSCPNCYYEMVVDPGWYRVEPPEPHAAGHEPEIPSDWPLRARLYEEAVRRRVCERCEDFGADSICYSKDSQGCAIFRYLPALVQIASELHEKKVEAYIPAIRKRLCMKCYHSDWNAENCELRDTLDCGLDRYLPLVLEAIEEVDGTLF